MGYYFRENRAWVKGLVMGCPFNEPFPGCPLKTIRQRSPADRLRHVITLTEKELIAIISHHKMCLDKREAELLT